jgi:ribosomal protein L28
VRYESRKVGKVSKKCIKSIQKERKMDKMINKI